MFRATNIHYDLAERTRGFAYGGLGAMQLLAQQTVAWPRRSIRSCTCSNAICRITSRITC